MPRSDLRWTVDPTRLKQAIVNLVSNAVNFTPRGGRVTLAAFEENDRLVIRVGDTGYGMTAAQIEHVLQPFAQIHTALSRTHAGTCLPPPQTTALSQPPDGRMPIPRRPAVGTQQLGKAHGMA